MGESYEFRNMLVRSRTLGDTGDVSPLCAYWQFTQLKSTHVLLFQFRIRRATVRVKQQNVNCLCYDKQQETLRCNVTHFAHIPIEEIPNILFKAVFFNLISGQACDSTLHVPAERPELRQRNVGQTPWESTVSKLLLCQHVSNAICLCDTSSAILLLGNLYISSFVYRNVYLRDTYGILNISITSLSCL